MSLTGTSGTFKLSAQSNVKVITSDGQLQLAAHQSCGQVLVPRSLQTTRDVRQSAQQHVFFDGVAWKPTSVQYNRTWKEAVSVEVVWSVEYVLISDGDHNIVVSGAYSSTGFFFGQFPWYV